MTVNRQISLAHNSEGPIGLRALDGTLLPLTEVVAQGRLCNELFQLSVEQHYRNPGRSNLETVYTFPLMPDAVLLGVELQIGERRLAGRAVPVSTARQDYEEALEDGNSAAMLEKAADGLYTVSVGNLLAGETASIRYQYAQPICTKNGTMRITIPTTVAPRYGNPATRLQPHQLPESDLITEYPFTLTVQIEGESNHDAIKSPTHVIALSTTSDSTRVGFPRASLDRDVVIMIQQSVPPTVYIAETDTGCIAYAPVAATLPDLGEQLSAMSLRIVIDCSGSMVGSIKSARRGAMRALEVLTDTDEYSITRFGSTIEHFDQRLTMAVEPAKRHALCYLQGTDATLGGTEMASALAAVSRLAGAAPRSDVLLVTDGEIWAIDELVAFAQRSEMRYFIVGVGVSPSHDNLLRLAESTGGAYVAVTPGEDIEQAMEALLARIQLPRIGAARLRWPSACQWQTRLPLALFRHEAVAVFAGLSTMPTSDSAAVLRYSVGGTGDGHRRDESLAIKRWTGDPTLLLRVATAMRIRELESGHKPHAPLTEAEATRLAVEHNLVSRYTNYLVIMEREEAEKPVDLPSVVSIKQMVPPVLVAEYLDLDIPAFYRQQDVQKSRHSAAETQVSNLKTLMCRFLSDEPPVNFSLALNKRMSERNTGVVPSRIAVLARLGLNEEIADAVRKLVRDGADEGEAVIALLLLLADACHLDGLSPANLGRVRALQQHVSADRLSWLQAQLLPVVKAL